MDTLDTVRLHYKTLRPRQNGRHFADDIFKCIFVNEIVRISIKISLKFVPEGPVNNIPALVQIMAWRRPGDKPLSEPVMVSLLTHICVTRPQWVINAVNFPQIARNRHLIARPWGRGMGCLLWVWSLIYVLRLSSQCQWQYRENFGPRFNGTRLYNTTSQWDSGNDGTQGKDFQNVISLSHVIPYKCNMS